MITIKKKMNIYKKKMIGDKKMKNIFFQKIHF
jgi:hypothetical protein